MTRDPPVAHPSQSTFPSGLAELAPRYDVLLCDLWGVVHNGRHVFAPAIAALRQFREGGGTVVFITNAPRPQAPVLEQMRGLGVPADSFDDIVTSGDVTMRAVATRGREPLYHIGPERDLALFEAIESLTHVPPCLASLDEAAYVVVTGLFDDARETPDDYAPSLARMRERRLPMICANPDVVVHVGDRLIYCGGALAEAYAALGGEVVMAGKPHPPIYEAALDRAAACRAEPVDRARVLAIGDGLRTDVAGAAGQALDMLFITAGIHRAELHPGGDGVIDRLAYAEHVAAPRPLAAIPHLVW